MDTPIVTRIAPSPTGHLHIGTVRTALFNFLYAKKHKGTFIVRSEDTDRERSTKEFEDEITEGLAWLGLKHDEYYRQSERRDIYKKYLLQMIDDDAAYTSIEESRQDPSKKVEVVRLRNPNKKVTFIDEVRGEIAFDTKELGDFVIARSVDDALYHFAVVVDDHEMKVTHVIRGEDHISNTPRQILLQEAIGAVRPVYAHLPLILAPDRSKLSKRHGAVSLLEYQHEGFLPEAILNYLALLGWNPGTDQELYTLSELIETFELTDIQKGGAIFDKEKLIWFNKEYIKKLDDEVKIGLLMERIPDETKSLPQYSEERLERLSPTIYERIGTLGEIEKEFREGDYNFIFEAPDVDVDLLAWKKDKDAKAAVPRLTKAVELLEKYTGPKDNVDQVKQALWPYAEEVGRGELLWPMRVALTGKERSPDPFTIIVILGIEESIDRLKRACATINSA